MAYDDEHLEAIAQLEMRFKPLLHKKKWLGVSVNRGWLPIVRELFEQVFALPDNRRVRVIQVKQKFAELRFYYEIVGEPKRTHMDILMPGAGHMHLVDGPERLSPLMAEIDTLIEAAQSRAARTCETCGAQGRRVNDGGYLRVSCVDHFPDVANDP